MNMRKILLGAINEVRANKGLPSLDQLSDAMQLREDLQMDSLDLAELTVRVESKTSVDIFADGIVTAVGEIVERLNGH